MAKKVLFLLPRVYAIIFIAIITLFAFDTPIFSMGFLWRIMPSFLMVAVLALGWRNSTLAAFMFAFLAVGAYFFLEGYDAAILGFNALLFLISSLARPARKKQRQRK